MPSPSNSPIDSYEPSSNNRPLDSADTDSSVPDSSTPNPVRSDSSGVNPNSSDSKSDADPNAGDHRAENGGAASSSRRDGPRRSARSNRPRRIKLPVILFVLTCISTFWAGACGWMPLQKIAETGALDVAISRFVPEGQEGAQGDATRTSRVVSPSLMPIRQAIYSHWQDGLIYMACVIGILFTHEMGHFLVTEKFGFKSSLPIFLPVPIFPFGTMGAVIVMDGRDADRKQMYDIGIAGPLAGLVIAIPVMIAGVLQLDLSTREAGGLAFECPMGVSWLMSWLRPDIYEPNMKIWISQLNPYFMAGWVGLLITGLNMMPVGQLDGGHVLYALLKKRAHDVAMLVMLCGGFLMVMYEVKTWLLMFVLVMIFGYRHPPTSDDDVPLGWFRIVLGVLSFLIPVLCLAPNPFHFPDIPAP